MNASDWYGRGRLRLLGALGDQPGRVASEAEPLAAQPAADLSISDRLKSASHPRAKVTLLCG